MQDLVCQSLYSSHWCYQRSSREQINGGLHDIWVMASLAASRISQAPREGQAQSNSLLLAMHQVQVGSSSDRLHPSLILAWHLRTRCRMLVSSGTLEPTATSSASSGPAMQPSRKCTRPPLAISARRPSNNVCKPVENY